MRDGEWSREAGAREAGGDVAYHQPVMVREVLDVLAPAGDGEIMDGTVGGGGHSRALLERYPECRILAVDRDPAALKASGRALDEFGGRVRFQLARFDEAARTAGVAEGSLSGALLDLGVSTHQLDRDARGFSFRPDAPLDMRMGGADQGATTAAEILNRWDESALRGLFQEYGEEPKARRLAKAVTLLRGDRPFATAGDLLEALRKAYRRPPTPREKSRVFQALRIEVNRELESVEAALPLLREALRPGGIIVVISYHSLEDRMVKHAFRDWSRSCVCPPGLPVCVCDTHPAGQPVTRKAMRPSEAEIEANPRSRSARLRAWRKSA